MPTTTFATLPDAARVWVFASDRPLTGPAADRLLADVDGFLASWAAHGEPLRGARDFRDGHFLAIGVDQRDAHASGCSIDGLFRVLKALEPAVGASLLGGGRVAYRDVAGTVQVVDRDEFSARAARGEIDATTPVFDATITTAADWRTRFEKPAEESWHGGMLSGD